MKKLLLFIFLPVLMMACNSTPGSTEKEEYVPPVKEEIIKYYANGKMRTKGMTYDGERHGKWSYYYENGFLWSEGNFFHGKRDGYALLFYDNGRKMVDGEYKENVPVGEWRFYNEQGELVKTVDADENPEVLEQEMSQHVRAISSETLGE